MCESATLIGFPIGRSPVGERGSSTNVEINISNNDDYGEGKPEDQLYEFT
ncbi:MAG: hypothetical protein SWX82_20685 [Cyanobacteriota bacterium]|nr:hypothetical protein [Cyanobacteriota bacterium]